MDACADCLRDLVGDETERCADCTAWHAWWIRAKEQGASA